VVRAAIIANETQPPFVDGLGFMLLENATAGTAQAA
jgi:hypothetical protein